MNLSKTLSSTALLALLGSSHVQAAALADIYQQALQNDPQLKSAQANSLATQQSAPIARANLLPQINLQGSASTVDSDSNNYDSQAYTLSLSQPLFDAASWYGFKQGEEQSEQAKLQYGQAQQNLIQRVVSAYLDVLRAQTALETNQAQERAIKRRLDQVNAQFEVGLIAITDVQEAQASYDNARVDRIEAEGALDNSFEAIERLTAKPFGDIDMLAKDYPVQNLAPADSQPWLEKAWQGNFDLRIADANIDIQRHALKATRAGHLPTVSVSANHNSTNGTSMDNSTTDTSTLMLSVNVPIFSGYRTTSQSNQAQYQLDSIHQNREDTLRSVTQQTRSLLRDLRTNVQSVAARAQSIKSSATALKATEEGFKVGTRNVVDVLQAEQTLYQAQRDYANARYSYVQNLFTLKQQVGTLNPDDINSLDKWLVKP